MADAVEQGSLESVLHIDIDKNDLANVTKHLTDLAKDSTLQNGFKELGNAMNKGIASSTSGFDRLQASIEKVADILGEVSGKLESMPQSLAKNTIAKSAEEAADELENLKKKAEEAWKATKKKKEEETAAAKTTNVFKERQKELKAEISQLIVAGKGGTEQCKKLEAELANVTDQMGDMQKRVSLLANDEGFTQGMIQGLGGVAAGFQVAQGAVGLFADENEELNKILLKVQSLMGIVNGLMTIQQTLNKDSAFTQNVLNKAKEWWATVQAKAAATTATDTVATVANTVAEKANAAASRTNAAASTANAAATAKDTAATVADTAAKGAGAVANKGFAMSLRTVGIAIKSIPVIGWIIAGISALIAVMKHFADEEDKLLERTKEIETARQDSYAVFAKESMLLEEYTHKLETFNGNEKQEQKLLDELNGKYGEQLGHFNNLAEAKKVLTERGEDYINMLMLEAQAEALRNLAAEKAAKKLATQNLDADLVDGAWGSFSKLFAKSAFGLMGYVTNMSDKIDEAFHSLNEGIKEDAIETLDLEEKAARDAYNEILKQLEQFKNEKGFGNGTGDNSDYTYLEKLQRRRAEAQKNLERLSPQNTAAINSQKAYVHQLDEQIKAYQSLITYETYFQGLQRRRAEAMEKLEGMDTTKATKEEIEAQKEVVRQLDEQIKAHQRKVSVNTYYAQILADIGEREEKLKNLSLEDAQNHEIVNKLKEEIKALEKQKELFEDLISTNTYYQSLQQQIARDKERLNSLTEQELQDTQLIARLRQSIADNQEKQRQFEEATRTDFSSKVNDYKAYAQEIVKIEEDRKKKIAAIDANTYLSNAEREAQKKSVDAFAELNQENAAAQYAIEDPAMIESLKGVVDTALGMSMEEIQKRMPQVIKEIKELEKRGGDNSGALAELYAEFKALGGAAEELQKMEDKMAEQMGSDKRLKKFQQYFMGITDAIGGAINELDDLSDEAKETMNTILDFATSGMDMISNIDLLVHSTTQGMKTTAETAATSIATVEKASVILAIISAVIQIAVKIANLFANRKTKKANKEIEQLQGQVDALQDGYDALDEAISKAYGNSAVDLINQQDTLLRQQKTLIQQQIAAEKTKKSKKQDANQIKEWEDQIKEIDKTLAGRKETIVEALIGKDYKSVLEDFTGEVMSAMDDAETSVEDAVKNIGKSIKKAAVQTKLNETLQPITTNYADKLADAMKDGFLDEYEKKSIADIEATIASTSEQYLSQFDDLWEKAAEERNAVKGGITNMSQDSADEMNGRLTQMQSHTNQINETTKELRDFSSRQLIVLQGIHTDTSALVATTTSIKATLEDMTIRGVKLKS